MNAEKIEYFKNRLLSLRETIRSLDAVRCGRQRRFRRLHRLRRTHRRWTV